MAYADGGQVTMEQLVSRTATLYSLPLIYEQLSQVINHPRCSIDDIAKIINEDQGLTARLLKLANSPMFGYFSKIDTIHKAVTVIGTEQLRDLALATSVMEIFQDIPRELFDMVSFWRHSVACGIVARSLATYRREINVERFFAAGILHDVGKLVMCTTIPDVVRGMLLACEKEQSLYFKRESETLGFTHAALGGELFAKWKIPASIVEPVACHHTPNRADRFPMGAAIIHLADIVCHSLELGHSGERLVPSLDESAWKRVEIPAGALPGILKQAEPQWKETFAILGKKVS